jgi:hypothetical protein
MMGEGEGDLIFSGFHSLFISLRTSMLFTLKEASFNVYHLITYNYPLVSFDTK